MEDRPVQSYTPKLLPSPTPGQWITPSPRIWRYYFNADDKELEVIREDEIDIYLPVETEGQTSEKYYKQHTIPYREPPGKPVTVAESDDGALRIKLIGSRSIEPLQQKNNHL